LNASGTRAAESRTRRRGSRFDGELAAAVRTVLDRSPELATFVTR